MKGGFITEEPTEVERNLINVQTKAYIKAVFIQYFAADDPTLQLLKVDLLQNYMPTMIQILYPNQYKQLLKNIIYIFNMRI